MSGLNIMPYQEESVRQIEDFQGRSLLALSPGLGKTIITLKWMKKHPECVPVVVVCPAAVKHHWQWEAQHYFGMRASVCEGQTPPSNYGRFDSIPKFSVINHDILKYWVPHFKQMRINTVILDECQNFGNPSAQRTKAVRELVKGVRNLIALSGTPMTIRPKELWPICNMLWPDEFTNFATFARRYCNPKWTPWGWKYDGASNLDELGRRLKVLGMIRYRKEDVLQELPDKVRRIIPIEMSDPDEYHEANTDFMAWLNKNMADRVRSAGKAEQLTKLGYLLRLAAKLKIRGVVDWANKFLEETDEKLILFAIHTKAIEVLQRRIEYKSIVIDGNTPANMRQVAKVQFQTDPKTRVCIGQMQAAGVGINLNAASEVGIMEYPWRPGDLIQAEDRPHRIGQKNTVFVNYFMAVGTIEERLCALLEKRQGDISTLLDGGPVNNDLNIHTELLRILEGGLVT